MISTQANCQHQTQTTVHTCPSFELSHYLGLCFPPWLIAAKLMQQALTHLRSVTHSSYQRHNIPPSAPSATSAQVVRNDLIFPESRGWLLSM